MMINKKTNAFVMCCAALALLLVFSGCGGGGGTPPTSIKITITDIDLSKMPAFDENMAGFTVSLIPANADVTINTTVGYMAMRTILDGPAAESVRAFLTNPPKTSPFSLDFNVQESAQFTGTGDYVVVFGASNARDKYDRDDEDDDGDTEEPYLEGKMFITNDDPEAPSAKGTRAISDGLTLSWEDDFLKKEAPAGDGKGYSATEIVAMF